MKSPFTDTFILLIDTILKDTYDLPISRKDYLTFFEWFERRLSRNETDSFKSLEINITRERTKWGRVTKSRNTFWKLDTILHTLKKYNILNSTGYLPEAHSRKYSYSQAFLNAINIDTFSIVYEEVNDKIYNTLKNEKLYDISNSQYKLLKSSRFSINVDQCNSWLIDEYAAGEKNKTDKDNCLLNIRRVFDIHNKDIYAVKINNGRIYTSFSSLKKELRQFCYIDNKPLVSIDLKSSQPYFLASYLRKKYPNVLGVKKFYDIVTNDDIYNWILSKTNQLKNRDESKKEMFIYIFKLSNKGNCLVQEIIKRELPDLHDIIQKERIELNGFANFLQKIEADIFIPICERYSDKCLSVHDSLYFTKDIEKIIEKDLTNQFKTKGYKNYKYNIVYTINVVHFFFSSSTRDGLMQLRN